MIACFRKMREKYARNVFVNPSFSELIREDFDASRAFSQPEDETRTKTRRKTLGVLRVEDAPRKMYELEIYKYIRSCKRETRKFASSLTKDAFNKNNKKKYVCITSHPEHKYFDCVSCSLGTST